MAKEEIIKTDDKEEAQNKIKIYLEKHYYTAQNLDYFYNTHSIDKGENYHGYWCWEAAALVKIKNLDDVLLEDNINEEEKFKDFRSILNDKSYLKEFFNLAMKNQDRTIGKDYLEYGIYEKGNKKWEQIKSLITPKN